MYGENSCNAFAALHGNLGSYLRDALKDGNADVVACLHVHELRHVGSVYSTFPFDWWFPLFFL
jgi:hypothetical protein